MRNIKDMSREQLEQLAQKVQDALYLDYVENEETGEESFQYDPDKEWDCVDICSALAELVAEFDLAPSELTPRR